MAESGVIGSELEYGLSIITHNRPDLGFIPVQDDGPIKRWIESYAAAQQAAGLGHIAMAGEGLTNGGRLYPDHHHPEYSTPEVLTIHDLIKYELAGEKIVAGLCEHAKNTGSIVDYILTRRVSDHVGNTWGSHFNAQVKRAVLNPRLQRTEHAGKYLALALLMATRGVVVGSGGLTRERATGWRGFAISQKVMDLSLDYDVRTTGMKPLVNLRDEPLSDAELYTRLHDTSGDANLLMRPRFISVGMMRIMLELLEHVDVNELLPEGLTVQEGELVRLAKHAATDLTCKRPFEFACGYRATPVQINMIFAEAAGKLEDQGLLSEELIAARALWRHDLDALARSPLELMWLNEWVTRLGRLLGGAHFMEESASQDTSSMYDNEKLQRKDGTIDRVVPDNSNKKTILKLLREEHAKATAQEGSDKWFPTEKEIEQARTEPPTNTRAYDRGRVVRHLADKSFEGVAGWSNVVVRDSARLITLAADPREYDAPDVVALLNGC